MKLDDNDTGFGDIVSQIARTLRAANGYLADLLDQRRMEGLVPSHGDILAGLFSSEGPLSMARLARMIGKDPSTVTTLVKKLADSGYVAIRKSEEDRRVTLTELTDRGRALGERMEEINRMLLEAASRGLTEEELSRTRGALIAMRKNFEKARKDDPYCEKIDQN